MHLDRSRFLFLVGAIAGGACGPRVQPQNGSSAGGDGVAGPPPMPSSTSTSIAAVPTITPGGDPTLEGESNAGTPSTEGVGTYPAAEGYVSPVGEGYVGPVYTPGGKKRPFNVSTCSGEDVGKPLGCSTLKIDKSCAPFPFINEACADAVKYYKGRVAERAVSCIRSKKPIDLCDAMNVYDCKDEALHGACRDSTAVPDCKAIVSACPSTPMSECVGYLSGMNALGRSEMVKCMKGCNDLYSCTEGL